jgi:hypothetical protein
MRLPTRRAPTPSGEILLEKWLKPMKLTQLGLAKKMGVDIQLVNGTGEHLLALGDGGSFRARRGCVRHALLVHASDGDVRITGNELAALRCEP